MEQFGGAAAEALSILFSWRGLLITFAGTLLAMTTSFLPGIGSSGVTAFIIVLTIGWDPTSVMLLFGALTGGATFMGSVTAILFNVPGSASSAAALLDGYPLARSGYPRRAIACAATASAVGSVIGVFVLLSILPFIRPFLLAFGPFEMVLLGIWGLATLVAIPNVSPLKAAVMACLGFLVAMIGSSPTSSDPRWTFGNSELLGGVPLIPVLLGLFTFAEIVGWVRRYTLEKASLFAHLPDDSIRSGVTSVFRNFGLTFRSAIIGTGVGIVPGVGGTVASFVAYGQAAQAHRSDGNFGKGDIRGLIAPESAVDSKDGGSLLPVVAFGLPGSEGGVILLAVLALHGIVPGVPMLTDQLPLTYLLIFALLFSNILTSLVGVALTPALARLTELRIDRLVLPAIVLSLLSVIQLNSQITDIALVIAFGLGGYFLKMADWPRVPFVIAFILGEFLETNIALSAQLIPLGRIVPWERPASLAIFVMLAVTFWWLLRKPAEKRKPEAAGGDAWIALAVVVLAAIFLISAAAASASPSALTMIMPSATLAFAAAAFVAAYRKAGFTGFAIPQHHRRPLWILALAPVFTFLLGFSPAMGATVFLWVASSSEALKHRWPIAVAAGSATAAACWYFVHEIAYMLLPEGLLWRLF